MSRNRFEADDPAEELPLEEQVQRQFSISEVDEAIEDMTKTERTIALGSISDTAHAEANIAKLKTEGMWATARFYERLLKKQTSTPD